MDSAEFLDLLGNENRRRILQLLARKPCYVTEISEYLGVSPKAVIDHLRKLEDAGLVESRTDSRRRKYFSIDRHVRLEVNLSPYEFGTKSAYPASSRLDLTSCRRVSIDLDTEALSQSGALNSDSPPVESTTDGQTDDESKEVDPLDEEALDQQEFGSGQRLLTTSHESVVELATQLQNLKQLERELSLAQRWTQGRITELREALSRAIGNGDPRLISDLLLALDDGGKRSESLSRELDVPVSVVEDVLEELALDGVVYREGHRWFLDR